MASSTGRMSPAAFSTAAPATGSRVNTIRSSEIAGAEERCCAQQSPRTLRSSSSTPPPSAQPVAGRRNLRFHATESPTRLQASSSRFHGLQFAEADCSPRRSASPHQASTPASIEASSRPRRIGRQPRAVSSDPNHMDEGLYEQHSTDSMGQHQHKWTVSAVQPVQFYVEETPGLFDIRNRTLLERFVDPSRPLRRFFVVDENVWKIYGEKIQHYLDHHKVEHKILVMPVDETDKTIENVLKIVEELCTFGLLRRHEPVIAVGGGVLLDMVGMAASLYRRGVPYIRVPTTLLGLVDASVGAKTGCNYVHSTMGELKNRMGTYWPPLAAFLDKTFLPTVDSRCAARGRPLSRGGPRSSRGRQEHAERDLRDAEDGDGAEPGALRAAGEVRAGARAEQVPDAGGLQGDRPERGAHAAGAAAEPVGDGPRPPGRLRALVLQGDGDEGAARAPPRRGRQHRRRHLHHHRLPARLDHLGGAGADLPVHALAGAAVRPPAGEAGHPLRGDQGLAGAPGRQDAAAAADGDRQGRLLQRRDVRGARPRGRRAPPLLQGAPAAHLHRGGRRQEPAGPPPGAPPPLRLPPPRRRPRPRPRGHPEAAALQLARLARRRRLRLVGQQRPPVQRLPRPPRVAPDPAPPRSSFAFRSVLPSVPGLSLNNINSAHFNHNHLYFANFSSSGSPYWASCII